MADNRYIIKTFMFDGKRHYVRGKTEEEAIKKLALKEKEVREGAVVKQSAITVREWAYKVVELYKNGQSTDARRNTLYIINRGILDKIGSRKIRTIKPVDCQAVLNDSYGKSQFIINRTYSLMRFIFSKAKSNGIILNDPTIDLIKPKGDRKTRRALTPKEEEAFLKVAQSPRFTLFLLMYYCGCRPSEAAECMGKDIQEIDNVPLLHIRGTKTVNADRYVPIPNKLYEKIKKTHQRAYISPNERGNKHTDGSYKRLTQRLYREMNIEMGCKVYRNALIPPLPLAEDFSPYCLRHTYCTNLQKKGVDIRTAQKLMGHSDIRMTANIYTHIGIDDIIDVGKLLK